MTLKTRVAKIIEEEQAKKRPLWSRLQSEVKEIRIKKHGEDTLIRLSGKDSFQEPRVWLRNYYAAQREHLSRSLRQACDALPPELVRQELSQVGLEPIHSGEDVEALSNRISELEEELTELRNRVSKVSEIARTRMKHADSHMTSEASKLNARKIMAYYYFEVWKTLWPESECKNGKELVEGILND